MNESCRPVVVISVNMAWNLANFRAGLIRRIIENGYRVVALAPTDGYAERVRELGCEFVHIGIDRRGINPVGDVALLANYYRVLRRVRPVAFLGFTIKPNVYGSLACHFLGIPVVNNIAGLGATFLGAGWLNFVARSLYKVALGKSKRVFFQNPDDHDLFLTSRIVSAAKSKLIPGSGVDTSRFSLSLFANRGQSASFTFLFVGRLLWDKGIGEYVAAARMLRESGLDFVCKVLGFIDTNNPSGISREELDAWAREGVIEYLGAADDVRPEMAKADCVVLPSYREGAPRSLIEAASMSRPVITTRAPGCKEVVVDGVTGFLVEPRSAQDLARAMADMCSLSGDRLSEMGASARAFVCAKYDERIVIDAYMEVLKDFSKPVC